VENFWTLVFCLKTLLYRWKKTPEWMTSTSALHIAENYPFIEDLPTENSDFPHLD
jgi:hypothetical protein